VEFGLLEFMREVIAWCYLKNHNAFRFDPATETIRYEYHVFEAPHTPKMAMGCSGELSGFTCSREAFLGPTGSLRRPDALAEGALGGEELPLGGHGCGVLAREFHLEAGTGQDVTYILAVGDTWGQVDAMIETFRDPAESAQAVTAVRRFWSERLSRFQVASQDPIVDAFVNVWNPVNAMVACELARSISTDHMGLDGLRYRDTMQDALAVAHLDAEYAADRVRLVLAQQTAEGAGCFAFYPDSPQPTCDQPDRSDNTVWPIYTVENLLAETGDLSLLAENVPYRDGSTGSVFDHLLRGLKYVHGRRGANGLPLLAHADWNDGLALFQDERAESVMLAMQMVSSCRRLAEMADRIGRSQEADWCRSAADGYDQAVNSDTVWDGRWYRRLILSDGTPIGSADRRQGQIYLTVQAWSVISGVARDGRGKAAMDAVAERLDSECGLAILAPPFVGFPEPEDPPLGSNPGVGENGGIFCHANTWAIIAEALLGRADRAWKYYRQLLPPHVIDRYGVQHYQREPYVYVSSIVGPCSERLGEGGISWLTGTASWMYEAVTKHLLGVHPTMDGLRIRPCLAGEGPTVRVQRRFRGCRYDIDVQPGSGPRSLLVNGEVQPGDLIRPAGQATCHVQSVVTSP
jgi:cellobiose phosphorylase